MEKDLKEEMALFRYSLIAPLVAETYTEESKIGYCRAVTSREYHLPDGRVKKFSPYTIKKWYQNYGKNKLVALTPKVRSDAGESRTLTSEMIEEIIRLREKFPRITGVMMREKMIESGIMKPTDASLDSIYRYLKAHNMSHSGMPAKECLSFEFEHANDCWQADTADGPVITIGAKRVQTYLISFIDDASRLFVHAEFYTADNQVNMQDAFKKAIMTYGVPIRCFDDNGSVYKNTQISMILAELGIVEIHSKPYHPRGKGKEERSHLTAHFRWIDCTDWNEFSSLEEMNKSFSEFIDTYNNTVHSSIGMTPKERYLMDYDLIHHVDKDALEEAFLHRVTRKVSTTACVSIKKKVYEVEQRFIGKTVSVRYDPKDMSEIYVYDDSTNTRLCVGRPVKKLDNAKRKRRANISYGQMDGGM